MKPNISKKIIDDIKQRGYVEVDNVFYPPNSPQVLTFTANAGSKAKKKSKSLKTPKIKSGWIDDTRNISNREKQADMFIKLIGQELNLDVWPEFYFSTERLYRLDYAIPVDRSGNELKIAIEVQGGIWAKGNSGHSSGKGIKRDMDKSNLAQSLGWFVIKIEPAELLSIKTLELIKSKI